MKENDKMDFIMFLDPMFPKYIFFLVGINQLYQ